MFRTGAYSAADGSGTSRKQDVHVFNPSVGAVLCPSQLCMRFAFGLSKQCLLNDTGRLQGTQGSIRVWDP
eukprot:5608273-Alexandrium_andersonii.AAC.1